MAVQRGVSVADLRKAAEDADPSVTPKVLILRGQRSFDDEDNDTALGVVVRRLKGLVPGVEFHDLALPAYRILSDVSNDPDDTLFAPDDQFPLVMEALEQADIVIVSTRAACGMPSADVVRTIERLNQAAQKSADDGTYSARILSNKYVAVITTGDTRSNTAAILTASALNTFGCSIVRSGLISRVRSGALSQDKEFVVQLEQVASDIADICKR